MAGIADRANSTAYRQRDENLAGSAGDHVGHDLAGIAGGGDIEEDQLVGAVAVVAIGELDGISGVAQVDEVDAFDDAPAGDIETGDDALG